LTQAVVGFSRSANSTNWPWLSHVRPWRLWKNLTSRKGRSRVPVWKMNNYQEIFVSLIKRVLIAVPFLVLGLFIMSRASGGMLGVYAGVLLGCAGIIVAAIILAFPLARLVVESSGKLFWPSRHFDRPQPMYSIPEAQRARGHYEEAMTGFEKIAEEFPDELKPFVEMIDIAIRDFKDPARAKEIYQRGIALLKREKDREALAKMYSAIRTRLNSRPSN